MSNAQHRSTFDWLKRAASVCCSIVVLLAPAAARADTLDAILDLVLNSIDSKILDEAPAGVSSAKASGLAKGKRAARAAKRARKAQAERFYNTFGRISF